jgi:hypothetical protein
MAAVAELAGLTIPAEYVEDARAALIQEIQGSVESARSDQDRVLVDPGEVQLADRADGVEILLRNIRLPAQFVELPGGPELTAECDNVSHPLLHLLEQMMRVLTSPAPGRDDLQPTRPSEGDGPERADALGN